MNSSEKESTESQRGTNKGRRGQVKRGGRGGSFSNRNGIPTL